MCLARLGGKEGKREAQKRGCRPEGKVTLVSWPFFQVTVLVRTLTTAESKFIQSILVLLFEIFRLPRRRPGSRTYQMTMVYRCSGVMAES